jgi:CheY-like chemotaxis protein
MRGGTEYNNDRRGIVILLVDDDADCRMLVRDALTLTRAHCRPAGSRAPVEVFEVGSGEEALEFLARRGRYANAPRPSLIYLDIEMPGINGLETLRQIKTSKELREIPVVMMTGVRGGPEMRRAAQLGANSYTLKPADAAQFVRTVQASTTYWLTIHQFPEQAPALAGSCACE